MKYYKYILLILIALLSHMALANTTEPKGHIDKLTKEGDDYFVYGWACVPGMQESIPVQLYAYSAATGYHFVEQFTASSATADEPALQSVCEISGATEPTNHRFRYALPSSALANYAEYEIVIFAFNPVTPSIYAPITNSHLVNLPSGKLDILPIGDSMTSGFYTYVPPELESPYFYYFYSWRTPVQALIQSSLNMTADDYSMIGPIVDPYVAPQDEAAHLYRNSIGIGGVTAEAVLDGLQVGSVTVPKLWDWLRLSEVPDLAVLQLGGNDAVGFFTSWLASAGLTGPQDNLQTCSTTELTTALDIVKSRLQDLIDELKSKNSQVPVYLVQYPEVILHSTVDITQNSPPPISTIDGWAFTNASTQCSGELFRGLNQVIADIAASDSLVYLVPPPASFDSLGGDMTTEEAGLTLPDGTPLFNYVHPSKQGADKIAQQIFNVATGN